MSNFVCACNCFSFALIDFPYFLIIFLLFLLLLLYNISKIVALQVHFHWVIQFISCPLVEYELDFEVFIDFVFKLIFFYSFNSYMQYFDKLFSANTAQSIGVLYGSLICAVYAVFNVRTNYKL